MNMEKTVYYVAQCSPYESLLPVIVEKFNSKGDADLYASLMSRTKQHKYAVLTVVEEWDADQEN